MISLQSTEVARALSVVPPPFGPPLPASRVMMPVAVSTTQICGCKAASQAKVSQLCSHSQTSCVDGISLRWAPMHNAWALMLLLVCWRVGVGGNVPTSRPNIRLCTCVTTTHNGATVFLSSCWCAQPTTCIHEYDRCTTSLSVVHSAFC